MTDRARTTPSPVVGPVGLLVAALLLTGCAADAQPDRHTVTIGGTAAATPATVERPWGTVKVFPEMQKAEQPAAADLVFATDMVTHHRQAIELATFLLVHAGVDDRIVAAARFIADDQLNEIGVMESWLTAWDAPTSGHGHHTTATMPGMLPQARVDAVADLPMPEAQVAFLVAMVEHHEGAVAMSQDYLPEQGNAFTRSTAQHIISEQRTEIDYMEGVIAELCASDAVATCPA